MKKNKKTTTSAKTNEMPQEKRKFGSIRQKTENCFEALYRYNGQRKSFTAKTYEEAEVKLNKIEQEIEEESHRVESTMPLRDWLTHWLDAYVLPTTAVSTYAQYKEYCNNHVIPKIGNVPLGKMILTIMVDRKAVSNLKTYYEYFIKSQNYQYQGNQNNTCV